MISRYHGKNSKTNLVFQNGCFQLGFITNVIFEYPYPVLSPIALRPPMRPASPVPLPVEVIFCNMIEADASSH